MTTPPFRAAAIAFVLAAAAVPTAPASPPGPEKDLTPAERIKKALDGVADVSVENQPLEQALRQLGEQAKVNFVVDRFALQHIVGDPQGLVVNVSLKGTKVRSALRAILSQHNLDYAVVGDTVVVSTEEGAVQRQMRQRVIVDVEGVPVEQALKRLARETGANLVLDGRLPEGGRRPVTLRAEDVPLETAVGLLARMAGLRAARVGNLVLVTDKATAEEIRREAEAEAAAEAARLPRLEAVLGGVAGIPGPGGVVVPQPPRVRLWRMLKD